MRHMIWIAALVLLPAAGRADTERILSFHSEITLNQDSSMLVKETIRVRAEGKRIKRGIYRDFPHLYRGQFFTRRTVPFSIVEASLDGRPVQYRTERRLNGTRIYFGQENVFLKPGEYSYVFTYKTGRYVGYFDNYDELYWNVTGTGWEFEIADASAVVILPETLPVDKLKLHGYTGPQGAKGKAFSGGIDDHGRPVFRTTQPLSPREGLTICVTFPKGFIAEPPSEEKWHYFMADNRGLAWGGLGVALVFVYYLIVWALVGRDPDKGTIIPRFEPPEEMSPGAMRYLREMGYDERCMAAVVINMAVKGYLEITEDDGEYALTRLKDETQGLPAEERRILKRITRTRGKLRLSQKNHSRIGKAVKNLKESLAFAVEKRHFVRNLKFFIPGVLLSLVTLAAAAWYGATGSQGAPLTESSPEILAAQCSSHFSAFPSSPVKYSVFISCSRLRLSR